MIDKQFQHGKTPVVVIHDSTKENGTEPCVFVYLYEDGVSIRNVTSERESSIYMSNSQAKDLIKALRDGGKSK